MGVRIKERKQKTDSPLSLCVIPVIFFFVKSQSDEKILSLPILFRRPQHSSLSENRCFFFFGLLSTRSNNLRKILFFVVESK